MIRTQIYIPETVHRTVKLVADRKKKTLAELIRAYIILGLKKEQSYKQAQNLSSIIQLGITGGPKDLSGNLDKYLYQK